MRDADYQCAYCGAWYVVRVLAADCLARHVESNIRNPRDDCESSGGVTDYRGVDVPETSEQWRPIAGFDGRYEVSDQGRVRSWVRAGKDQGAGWKRRAQPIVRRPHVNRRTGYWCVTLRLPPRYVTRTLHRLVLEAFAGPCPVGMEACHHDGDREHNGIGNLRWDTRSSNARDRTRHGTNYQRQGMLRDANSGRFIPMH